MACSRYLQPNAQVHPDISQVSHFLAFVSLFHFLFRVLFRYLPLVFLLGSAKKRASFSSYYNTNFKTPQSTQTI